MSAKLSIAAAVFALAAVSPLAAQAGDREFFDSTAASGQGPGEIVAGKYKGTKFTCDLKGESKSDGAGLKLDGSCRVGVFAQRCLHDRTRGESYKGSFLDGYAARVSTSFRAPLSAPRHRRHQPQEPERRHGSPVSRYKNTLNVTISVRVNDSLVPVIGMTLGARWIRPRSARSNRIGIDNRSSFRGADECRFSLS